MIKGIAIPVLQHQACRPGQDVKTYLCLPPVLWSDWKHKRRRVSFFVNVSSVKFDFSGVPEDLIDSLPTCETYIFPADMNGNVISWSELKGSFQGETDHVKAMRGAGYAVYLG